MINKLITVKDNRPSDQEMDDILKQFEQGKYYQTDNVPYYQYSQKDKWWEIRIITEDI